MSATTKIEWTDRTWNPVRGCSLVSAGCANCYAMKQAHRFSKTGQPYAGLTEIGPHGARWTGKVMLVRDAISEPLTWTKPCRVFVNSMSDLFHEDVPDSFIEKVYQTMCQAKRHTFQILTKRPKRMLDWISRSAYLVNDPPKNIWLGVSIENQQTADERIPVLLQTPAAVRFVSAEPLLGPVDLYRWTECGCTSDGEHCLVCLSGGLKWVIVGGESGPGARLCDLAWIRSIKDQCQSADVPVFIKQVGKVPYCVCGQCGRPVGYVLGGLVDACGPTHAQLIDEMKCLKDSKGGNWDEWPADLRMREFPTERSAG